MRSVRAGVRRPGNDVQQSVRRGTVAALDRVRGVWRCPCLPCKGQAEAMRYVWAEVQARTEGGGYVATARRNRTHGDHRLSRNGGPRRMGLPPMRRAGQLGRVTQGACRRHDRPRSADLPRWGARRRERQTRPSGMQYGERHEGRGSVPSRTGEAMAGIGPVPVGDAERQRSPFGWVDLPAGGRVGPTPPLPAPAPWLVELSGFPPATRTAWAAMWKLPQATQWLQDGTTLHHWATVHAKVSLDGPTAALLAELRQIEDRHGVSPAALARLRWRIVDKAKADEAPAPTKAKAGKPRSRKESILRLVGDGEATAG